MTQVARTKGGLIGWAVAAVLALVLIGQCVPAPPSGTAGQSSVAPGTVRYVSAKALNCRAAASKTADNVRSLRRGDQVAVVEEAEGWARLENMPSCWVSATFLSNDPIATSAPLAALPAAVRGDTSSSRTAPASQGLLSEPESQRSSYSGSSGNARSAKARRSARSSRKRKSRGGYGGGACPCSGGTVCIGPRGGRFCITSGGNKRYGV